MASLYQLGYGISDLIAQYEAAETDEEADVIWQKVQETADALDDKVGTYAQLLRNKETESEMYAAEIKRLQTLKKSADKLTDRLKSTMLDMMRMWDKKEYKTSIGVWKRKLNPPHVEITDYDKIPMEYHVPQPDAINKQAMLKLYRDTGEVVDGVDIVCDERVQFK